MAEYNLLFLGDVVGEPGRKAVEEGLPSLQDTFQPLITVVNGENAAAGTGITPKIAEQFLSWNVDAITLGNHALHKREIAPFLQESKRIVRPANMQPGAPGRGTCFVEKDGVRLAVMNLCGRVGMEPIYDDPFATFDRMFEAAATQHVFLDFHAEATSEKITMGWHADGRATAVIGTHTHVTTADERVLPGGTAYLTDVGMCGPRDSVLGMDRDIILRRFRTGLAERFEVAKERGVISAVVIGVQRDTGRAVRIQRVAFSD